MDIAGGHGICVVLMSKKTREREGERENLLQAAKDVRLLADLGAKTQWAPLALLHLGLTVY